VQDNRVELVQVLVQKRKVYGIEYGKSHHIPCAVGGAHVIELVS
jgi:hypothetical protein